MLSLQKPTPADNGVYAVTIQNEFGKSDASVTVNVDEPPEKKQKDKSPAPPPKVEEPKAPPEYKGRPLFGQALQNKVQIG